MDFSQILSQNILNLSCLFIILVNIRINLVNYLNKMIIDILIGNVGKRLAIDWGIFSSLLGVYISTFT
jgi:hypothetical protein